MRGCKYGIWAGAVVIALSLASCGEAVDRSAIGPYAGVVEEEEQVQIGGTLVYGVSAESNGWNPASSQWAPSGLEVVRQIFDPLAAFDSASQIRPFAAERFEHNATFTEWTIVLRSGIQLHNGKPVNADTVKRNQEFLMRSVLTNVAYAPIERFVSDGDRRVTVTMKEPWVNYPYALAAQVGVIADPDWLESGETRNPIGTGPFKFDHWDIDKELLVTKNPSYWRKDAKGRQLPFLDEIKFRPITDEIARAASLRDGSIHVMQTTNADQLAEFADLAESGDFQVLGKSGEGTEVFAMTNGMAPPFDDIDARRALAYATNKHAVIDIVSQGMFQPANGPFAPGSPWYTDEVERTYPQNNPGRARELVKKIRDRHGSFSFALSTPPVGTMQKVAEVLQQQYTDVGIEVQVETVEQAPLIVQVLTGHYQAAVWQQFDFPHPLGDSVWWSPETAKPIPEFALNFARNKDDRLGKLLTDARQTTDLTREKTDYFAVQKLLAEDVPYIWLYHNQITVVASNKVVNVAHHTLPPEQGEVREGLELQGGAHPLAQAWLKQ